MTAHISSSVFFFWLHCIFRVTPICRWVVFHMCVCRIRIASSLLLFSTNYTNFVFRSHSRLWNADLAVRIAIAISAITNEQQKNTHTGYRGAMQKILSFVVWHLIFVVRNKEKSNLWFYWSMRFIFCHYRHLSCMVVWIGC